jgi:hypothetical protein
MSSSPCCKKSSSTEATDRTTGLAIKFVKRTLGHCKKRKIWILLWRWKAWVRNQVFNTGNFGIFSMKGNLKNGSL